MNAKGFTTPLRVLVASITLAGGVEECPYKTLFSLHVCLPEKEPRQLTG